MIQTFRDAIRRTVPPWLTGPWGYRLLYSIAIQFDALGEALVDGVKLRFPGLYSPESLALLGRDRGIVRGFDEGDASYAARLPRWLDELQRRGNPYSLMRQIAGYLTPHAVKIRIVNNSGAWYTRNADGSTEYFKGTNWNWDGAPATEWSRYWIILYPGPDLWTRSTWGDGGLWGDGRGWGSSATTGQVNVIQSIVAEWQAPHASAVNIIVSFDATAFAPTDTAPPLPAGTWGNTANRDARALYWDGGN